ncbi:hypothetical protein MFIFM68171_04871 [Madurella fahalii]|uniref:C2H2-type domain-containing protein n=1 Tax=Madurella fahalii TaxID=1157608 RepID=A0ABQ0GAA1_9PEZI
MNSHSTNLYTDQDTWNIPTGEFHAWQTEQSPLAHDDLTRGLDINPVEVIRPEHCQPTADRSFTSNTPRMESVKPSRSIYRHIWDQCGKGFQSQKDVDRHRRCIHEKSTPYVCREAGCRRSSRGFSRRENYETHLLNVHRKPSKSGSTSFAVRREGKEPSSTATDHGLEGYSRGQWADILLAEREKCQIQQEELQEAKAELMKLKGRIDQCEDMWLKVLVAKVTK